MPDVELVDVSHYQDAPGGPPSSHPQWSLVHGYGLVGAAAKCCQAGVVDPEFHANWTAMRSFDDWCRINYMFADDDMAPVEQVTRWRRHVGSEFGPRDGVAIDFEAAKNVRPVGLAKVLAMLNEAEQQYQRTPINYMGNFYPDNVDQNPQVQRFPWWLPWYRQTIPPWPRQPFMWQFGGAQIPGINKPCDSNDVIAPLVLLAACAWPAGTPTPRPPTPQEPTMFNPPQHLEPVVASSPGADGKGFMLLGEHGGVYTYEGAQFYGAPSGKTYWADRIASNFAPLTDAERAAGKKYVVLASTGERYAFPG